MPKVKTPPVTIDMKDYEKFKLLLEQEGETIARTIRRLITAYNTTKLTTGRNMLDMIQEYLLTQPKKQSDLDKFEFSSDQLEE